VAKRWGETPSDGAAARLPNALPFSGWAQPRQSTPGQRFRV
jgi:hypothetical protein